MGRALRLSCRAQTRHLPERSGGVVRSVTSDPRFLEPSLTPPEPRVPDFPASFRPGHAAARSCLSAITSSKRKVHSPRTVRDGTTSSATNRRTASSGTPSRSAASLTVRSRIMGAPRRPDSASTHRAPDAGHAPPTQAKQRAHRPSRRARAHRAGILGGAGRAEQGWAMRSARGRPAHDRPSRPS
jgi:hypothetical protein